MSLSGATVVVVGAGYPTKRRLYQRATQLGAQVVLVDEPGHWSSTLADEGEVANWIGAPIVGEADRDAAAVLDALDTAGIRPDAVTTFWEDEVCVVARVAAALGLPGNPVAAIDTARSKVRTRELSRHLGLPTPKARRVRSLDELFAAANHVGFPAVVKPEFGASAMGCVRVDDVDSLPSVYRLVRDVVNPETDGIFRSGNDLLLEQYLDGVEFDIDLVMSNGKCMFSSVSQNWPTAEPSFQEKGLHCPPDHDRKAVGKLVELAADTAQKFGLGRGVLHIEGKCTSRGPRLVEVNARMGGGRVYEIVRDVWGVDLVEMQLRASLDLPVTPKPSRKPQCYVADVIIHAPATGRLTSLPLPATTLPGCLDIDIDIDAEIGDAVSGPEAIFASVLAEVVITAKDIKRARQVADEVIRNVPHVEPAPLP